MLHIECLLDEWASLSQKQLNSSRVTNLLLIKWCSLCACKNGMEEEKHWTAAASYKSSAIKRKDCEKQICSLHTDGRIFSSIWNSLYGFSQSSKRNVWSLQNSEHFRSWTGSVLGGLRVGRMFLGAEAGWMRAQLQPGQGIRVVWEESQGLEKATRLNFLCMKGELKVFWGCIMPLGNWEGRSSGRI